MRSAPWRLTPLGVFSHLTFLLYHIPWGLSRGFCNFILVGSHYPNNSSGRYPPTELFHPLRGHSLLSLPLLTFLLYHSFVDLSIGFEDFFVGFKSCCIGATPLCRSALPSDHYYYSKSLSKSQEVFEKNLRKIILHNSIM